MEGRRMVGYNGRSTYLASNTCSHCGKLLASDDATLCAECKALFDIVEAEVRQRGLIERTWRNIEELEATAV